MARPRKFDEADVVAAARDEFWDRGYTATSVDDLTAATGLGKGSLYGAFGDKHSLYLLALDDYIASAMVDVRAVLRDPAVGARERLVRHIRGQAKVLAADKNRRGCLMAKSAAELGATDADVEKKVERAYADWRDELTTCIREAQRDGTVDAERNPRTLAGVLLAFMRGQEALHKGGASAAQLKAAADEMVSLIPVS
ncbi:TetR/AcrR family transcriptional regulator [Mycolicibacterium moriokaense]|nr:TetR/AcrR family transcriptional regulator [Mycolicibacterium moriokaense]